MSKLSQTECPLAGCGAKLIRADHNRLVCAEGHAFTEWAHGGLQQVDPTSHKRGAVVHFTVDECMRLMDTGARLWNALVRYSYGQETAERRSAPSRHMMNRLLALAIDIRDDDHRRNGERKTQMDTEVERMLADGYVPDGGSC
jgi:hypothetical protein